MANPEQLDRFLAGQQAFGALVETIGDDQWSNPTPCTEWDVHALVNHLVNEQLWADPMISGQTIEQVGGRLDGDLLGNDPKATWRAAAKESAATFTAPGALDGTINSSMGPSPAIQYLGEMACDIVAHRWDLGQGVGQEQRFSDDELDLMERMVEGINEMREQLEGAGIFGPVVPIPDGADRQTRVLAGIGRVG